MQMVDSLSKENTFIDNTTHAYSEFLEIRDQARDQVAVT